MNYRTSNTAGTTTPWCPNGLNQYATVGGSGGSCSGGQSYSYDDRGNLTSDGARSFRRIGVRVNFDTPPLTLAATFSFLTG